MTAKRIGVGVAVAVGVGVSVGVAVAVGVGVDVGVDVGASVAVGDGLAVGEGVGEMSGVKSAVIVAGVGDVSTWVQPASSIPHQSEATTRQMVINLFLISPLPILGKVII
jgi:hypothetical protein